ncbi:hypothetical protein J6590_026924 [Homalodisca vitripennis]|nr:hypothetical protein J6590_026924 [Homalodisca vitripennis]
MHYAPSGTDVRPGVWDSHPLKTYRTRHWNPSREHISATTSRGSAIIVQIPILPVAVPSLTLSRILFDKNLHIPVYYEDGLIKL